MSYNHFSQVNQYIYFGKYIDNEVLNDLNKIKMDIIIDLTHKSDYMIQYNTDITLIKFPIVDMSICDDNRLWIFMEHLCYLLKSKKKIYIHCKGGHGRSACVAACLYGLYYNISAKNSLLKIKKAHSERIIMKERWRQLGAPQTSSQCKQVFRILDGI
jgi:protein-tyrosine phosphatase